MESSTIAPKLICGTAGWQTNAEVVRQWLDVLAELGIDTIDTAHAYGKSETLIGQSGAPARFVIDTKCSLGHTETVATKDEVIKCGKESLQKLGTKQVDVYYMHTPDHRTTLEETFAGLNELHRQGAFKRLGLSNYAPRDVDAVVNLCRERGWVVPTVYQGNYSAAARVAEDALLPTLRRHGMAYYAYSPLAGGFLTKTRDTLLTQGRMAGDDTIAQLYRKLFDKPSYLGFLDAWQGLAKREGISPAEMAHRWVAHGSALRGDLGDAVILGAKTPEQLRTAVDWIRKGPLIAGALKEIDAMWEGVKEDAELDVVNKG